jgi:glycosyltransferase involved in cell wall biosynthesis
MSMVGVTLGDPYSSKTFSGSSAGLFQALRDRDPAFGAVSAQPPTLAQMYYKAVSFRTDRTQWVQRYRQRADLFRYNSAVAKGRLRGFDSKRYDVVLQIAAFYNLARLTGRLTISYHDATLATYLKSPYAGDLQMSDFAEGLAYERRLYAEVDHLFTMSAWAKGTLVADFAVPQEKITVAGAGVNLRRLASSDGKSYEDPAILFVGKEFTRKGGDGLLRAFERARRNVPEATLTIVGPKTIGRVPDGVNFVGPLDTDTDAGLDRLLHEYGRATIFAMPSLYEPFGIVFLEAMAHALPCVVSDQCAMPEIIAHGETGFVQTAGDSSALAHSLTVLLSSSELRARMGGAGRERYAMHFGWDRTARIISETTEQLKVASTASVGAR